MAFLASLVSRMASAMVSRTSLCCARISWRASDSALRSILMMSHSERPTLGPPRDSGRLSVTTTAMRSSSAFLYFSVRAPSETSSSPRQIGLALRASCSGTAAGKGSTVLPLTSSSTAADSTPKSSETSYSRRTCSSGRRRNSAWVGASSTTLGATSCSTLTGKRNPSISRPSS